MARLPVGMYKLSKPFGPGSEPVAFFSRHTRITPSSYVYTSFVSNLVLAKSVAVGKTPRQT